MPNRFEYHRYFEAWEAVPDPIRAVHSLAVWGTWVARADVVTPWLLRARLARRRRALFDPAQRLFACMLCPAFKLGLASRDCRMMERGCHLSFAQLEKIGYEVSKNPNFHNRLCVEVSSQHTFFVVACYFPCNGQETVSKFSEPS